MQLTMMSQKSVLGKGVPTTAPRSRASRKQIAVRSNAAQAATTLNTRRSEEVGLLCWYLLIVPSRILHIVLFFLFFFKKRPSACMALSFKKLMALFFTCRSSTRPRTCFLGALILRCAPSSQLEVSPSCLIASRVRIVGM